MTLTGKEWQNLSQQQETDSTQNYSNAFSTDDSFLQFIVFGKKPVKQLLKVEGCKGLKIKIGLLENTDTEKQQLFPILVPVDVHGNELPFEYTPEETSILSKGMTIMEDPSKPPVKCPTSCS